MMFPESGMWGCEGVAQPMSSSRTPNNPAGRNAFNVRAQRRNGAKRADADNLCVFASLRLCVGRFMNGKKFKKAALPGISGKATLLCRDLDLPPTDTPRPPAPPF
jgi:hypothetical protein